MQFKKTFFDPGEPDEIGLLRCSFELADGKRSVYVYDRSLVLAINVALATRRPLLLAGEPGCGKTTLAANIARVKDWTYYQHTVTSRTQSSDLLWEFDALRRLNDANLHDKRLMEDGFYVEPGPLWWALAPDSAARRGMDANDAARDPAPPRDPGMPVGRAGAVLLIDELDKAEPEVPNDLLEVVDARSFKVRNRPVDASREHVLLVFATNGEREFPGAFQRRCVAYRFPERGSDWYVEVARLWRKEVPQPLAEAVADRLIEHRAAAAKRGQRLPGVAEYLDALAAMSQLDIGYLAAQPLELQSAAWQELERLVFRKSETLQQE